ncbi:HNH endonuclease [Flammeovirga kamogawensis]|uniref:HNH endonuclease n=1 Tax=Flammeovirga kamogawensis TaxID=373891 RepID=A0ABX8H291_9BACT|nr:HNH endonuclease [Flammeovirga kamogawensis]MBB6462170.1 hypothetical protein [Flammeovirga kamogawensis]QWG09427.1 HNH endonuclease [Flammeovirga kamogawensis]TRX64945.1 hypothetical protein EO216_20645 [Flammeovirga kamogawensis]
MATKRNYNYILEEEKLSLDSYRIFGKYIIYADGYINQELKKQINYAAVTGKPFIIHERKSYYLGKIVLTLFRGNSSKKNFLYLDGNPQNNNINNLMWGLAPVNAQFKERVSELPDRLMSDKTVCYKLPSFPGTYIDRKGRFYTVEKGYRLKLLKSRLLDGIPSASYISIDKKGATMYTHICMLEAFKGIKYGTARITWKDGDKTNAALSNLEVVKTKSTKNQNEIKEEDISIV